MDKKSKVLLWVLIIAVIISIGYTFYKTVIKQDFEVVNMEEEEGFFDAENEGGEVSEPVFAPALDDILEVPIE